MVIGINISLINYLIITYYYLVVNKLVILTIKSLVLLIVICVIEIRLEYKGLRVSSSVWQVGVYKLDGRGAAEGGGLVYTSESLY